jgi:hypothetical protein
MSDLLTATEHNETDSSIGSGPSALERIAIWLFAWVLKLYPRHFRELFAEEMLDVFSLAAGEASQDGIAAVVRTLLSELVELPTALLLEHLYQWRKRSMGLLQYNNLGEIRVARWVARCTSLLVGGSVLFLFLFNEDIIQDPTPPTLILGLLSLAVLAAWRWERVGGTLALLASPIFFISALIEMSSIVGLITPTWVLILIDAAIMLSFVIIGWLFVSVAKHAEVAGELGAEQPVPATTRKRSWVYWVVGLLGLLAIVFFVIPMVIPVRQQMEVTAVEFEAISSGFLTSRLIAAGAVVGIGSGNVQQPFFSVPGYELVVDGEIVQAFEYADVSLATTEASPIDSREDSIWNEVDWNGAPHFYQVRNVILLYMGSNKDTLATMEAAFGPPFAGGVTANP